MRPIHELKTKIPVTVNGEPAMPCTARIILIDNRWLFELTQENGGPAGSWHLSTILYDLQPNDDLSIDAGQDWTAHNIIAAAIEAVNLI